MSIIANDDLLISDLPPRRASWTILRPFCATFNGYEEFGRRLLKIAKNPSPNDLSELRGALFSNFRAWVGGTAGNPPSKKELAVQWWPVLELIRKFVRKHPPKRAFQKLSMERTMCYGECPVYKVSVDAKGNVRWNGEQHVRTIGRASWKIGREEINRLRELLRERKFRSFRKSYAHIYVTDHADCIITVEYSDGSKKRVEHYLGDEGAPAALRSLEHHIDKLLGTWKYMGEKPKPHHA